MDKGQVTYKQLSISFADLFSVIVCDDPGRPENGGRTINRGLYYSGSVRFNCNRKYRLDGALIIYCTKDGTWSKPAPKCLGKQECYMYL